MFKPRTKVVFAGFAVAALLVGCSSSSAPETTGDSSEEPVTLTYATYGGTFEEGQVEAWQKPFSAEHPHVSFANTSPSDTAMIKAQVEAGQVQWDIADVNPFFAAEYCGELVEPLDVTGVDISAFDPSVVGECYFGAFQYATIVSYNAEKWPDPATAPKTIEDYFDTEKFPGQRGVVSDPNTGLLEYALLADGVAADELYPLDVDRSLAKWDTIRDTTTFAANNGAMLQLATGNQVDLMMLVTSRTKAALDEGADFVPMWDQTIATFNTLVVPKGAPNKDLAMEFIQYILQPEPQTGFAEFAGVAPTNLNAPVTRDATGTKVDAFNKDVNTGELITVNAEWWGQNSSDTTAAFNTWLSR